MEPGYLDERQDSRNDQGRRNQVLLGGRVQVGTGRTGENDGRRDDTSQHRQRVLESQKQCQEHRHPVIEAKEWGRLARFLHEWQVWGKEEAIVIVAKETLPGQEHPLDTGDGRPSSSRLLLRHNGRRALILIHNDGLVDDNAERLDAWIESRMTKSTEWRPVLSLSKKMVAIRNAADLEFGRGWMIGGSLVSTLC